MKKISLLILILFSSISGILAQVQYTAGGSGNNFTLTYPANITALTAGLSFTFKANHTITGPATLNINGLGAISIKKEVSQNLAANDIVNGQIVIAVYDGTNFQMITIPGTPSGGPPSGSAGGDLSGTYPSPSVVKLQSRAVSSTAPSSNQVIGWNNIMMQWEPMDADAKKIQTRNVSATAPTGGQALIYNGGSFQWEPQTISGTLSGGTINYIPMWTSANSLGNSSMNDDGSRVSVGNMLSVGAGSPPAGQKLFVEESGTSGKAGRFSITNATNGDDAIYSSTAGTGTAGYFQINNTSATNHALYATTNGTGGNAIYGFNNGTGGRAGLFQISNATNSANAFMASTTGTGRAGQFQISNTSNSADGLFVTTNGTGKALNVSNTSIAGTTLYGVYSTVITGGGTGTKIAGYFSASGATNNYAAIFDQGNVGIGTTAPTALLHAYSSGAIEVVKSISNGTGKAGEFQISNSANASDAVSITTDGTGKSLVVSQTNTTNGGTHYSVYSTASTAAGITGIGGYFSSSGAGTNYAAIFDQGNVGIGSTIPNAKLDVAGDIKIANSAATCSATTEGSQRYNSTTKKMEYCNGSGWIPLGDEFPAGTIIYVNAGACPSGWTEYTAAQGRYIVGLPSGGSLAGTQGTALSNLENRAVGQHTHTVSDPGHSHSVNTVNINTGGATPVYSSGPPMTAISSSPTGISINNSGSVAGTNAPYIQLRACQKN